jgi:hypothetical protein
LYQRTHNDIPEEEEIITQNIVKPIIIIFISDSISIESDVALQTLFEEFK